MSIDKSIGIINQNFHLINFKSALATGFGLEFHNSATFRTWPPFTVLAHHASNAGGFYSFGTVQRIQVMPFDIFFGVFFHQWAWKLTATAAIAEIFRIKTGFYFTFQAGFAFSVITNKTSCTGILIFFTANAVNSTWRKQFWIEFIRHFHNSILFLGRYIFI